MFKEYAIKMIRKIIEENKDELVFFKGFSKDIVKEAADGSMLSFTSLEQLNKDDLLKEIKKGKHVGLFEHSVILENNDHIYRNNLYDHDYIYLNKKEADPIIHVMDESDAYYAYYVSYEAVGKGYKLYYNSYDSVKNVFEDTNINYTEVASKPIYYRSSEYDLFLMNIDKQKELNLVCKNNKEYEQAKSLLAILSSLIPVNCTIENRNNNIQDNLLKTKKIRVKKECKDILNKYWGENATFRDLKFYGDIENKTIDIISQGQLITNIISQSVAAYNHKAYQDLFITAPTGSGKSILFQIPSIYLHEKYNTLTIIITPLIALMKDQVDSLEEKGMFYATYINSTIDFTQREARIQQIKAGEKSLLYIAPELLVNTPLDYFIGDRKVGLFVVDEAHTVTSWGKDFRIDYWFLGDYLKEIRVERSFPVLCLTATAVYGGSEDVVNETVDTLNLINPLIYLGNVRRENIRYYITNTSKEEMKGSIKEFKKKKVEMFIKRCLLKKEKALIYCPYVVQVNELYEELPEKLKLKVGKYHARLSQELRTTMQEDFRKGDKLVMICTKAFGMGIDDPNITNVYHYAPTGNLSDYVQEIGRAARNPEINGMAKMDYIDADLRYVNTLYNVSGFKDFQLREIIRKINAIYLETNKKNLIITPEIFSYLFEEDTLDGKVKNALLLIEKDLEQKYGFKVLSVVPQNVNNRNYVCVPYDQEEHFLTKYKKYCTLLKDDAKYNTSSTGKVTTITHFGNIFLVDMAKLWQNEFDTLTFTDFKRDFFNGVLFDQDKVGKPLAMLRFMLDYKYPYTSVQTRLKNNLNELTKVFDEYHETGKFFTEDVFRQTLVEHFPEIMEQLDITNLILDMFMSNQVASLESLSKGKGINRVKFIQRRHDNNTNITSYRVTNTNYMNINYYFNHLLEQYAPNHDHSYYSFITYHNGNKGGELELAALLELFGLASYQIYGGNNSEVALTIYEPRIIQGVLDHEYKNIEVANIREQRLNSVQLLKKFFESSFESEERWNFVENYFLGTEKL